MGHQTTGSETETNPRQRGEKNISNGNGILYLCATPIGNLEDITLRAIRVLKEVDLIAAEDTRHTRKLLAHFNIHTPVTSYHQHNEVTKTDKLIKELLAGSNIALVSDAGMPGISDPGSRLVKASVQSGIKVVPVPGPTAAITGLVVSGLPTDRFVFEGFLPRGKKQRALRLKEIAGEERTVVLYEAPHRLRQTLAELAALDGEREVAVAREITKTYEEFIRGSAAGVLEHFKVKLPRGECTVIIGGAGPVDEKPAGDWPEAIVEHVAGLMAGGLDKKQAMKEAAVRRGISKKEVYSAMIGKQ